MSNHNTSHAPSVVLAARDGTRGRRTLGVVRRELRDRGDAIVVVEHVLAARHSSLIRAGRDAWGSLAEPADVPGGIE
jgi:hypothetical protein